MENQIENQIIWQLYYDDTAQSETMVSQNTGTAVNKARSIMSQLLWEVDNKVTKIYPDENKWTLRIMN